MSGFKKYDNDKPPMHLIPARALEEVARAMGVGAEKYGELNWTQCAEPRRFVAAALRHINEQVMALQDSGDEWMVARDPESALPSLAHAAASCMIALHVMLSQRNRPYDGANQSFFDMLEKFNAGQKETGGGSGA